MNKLYNYIFENSLKCHIHTNTLGMARSILALSTLLVIFLNPIDVLFHTGLGLPVIPNCDGTLLTNINFFCIFSFNLVFAKILAVIILSFVISGYYPKFTGILHWWIALSVNSGLIIVDGGAQVAAMLTFLIIPLTLTDNRINHWDIGSDSNNIYKKITAFLTIIVIKIQIFFIYFDAAISKLFAPSWTEGTALYYFINDPITGISGIRNDLVNFIFDIPILLVVTTYFIILLELLLAFSIFHENQKIKKSLFQLGVIFHLLIFLIFGIFTFALAMFSALIFLFIPINKNLSFNNLKINFGEKIKTIQ